MLSFSDFDEKQILFIDSSEMKDLSLDNENLLIRDGDTIKSRTSLHRIFLVFLIGETTLTSMIIRKMQEF